MCVYTEIFNLSAFGEREGEGRRAGRERRHIFRFLYILASKFFPCLSASLEVLHQRLRPGRSTPRLRYTTVHSLLTREGRPLSHTTEVAGSSPQRASIPHNIKESPQYGFQHQRHHRVSVPKSYPSPPVKSQPPGLGSPTCQVCLGVTALFPLDYYSQLHVYI